jgi:hypothetical protein
MSWRVLHKRRIAALQLLALSNAIKKSYLLFDIPQLLVIHIQIYGPHHVGKANDEKQLIFYLETMLMWILLS